MLTKKKWLRENWAIGLLAQPAKKKKYQLGRVAEVNDLETTAP